MLAWAGLASLALAAGAWYTERARHGRGATVSTVPSAPPAAEREPPAGSSAGRRELGEPVEPAAPTVERGPSESAPRTDREATALDVLSGRQPVLAFPVVATPPDGAFDYSLRDRLAPAISVPDARWPCQCEPGDPLCSCL